MSDSKTTEGDSFIVLKTWQKYWDAVDDGSKPFEVRKNDRPYRVGAVLILQRWEPETQDFTYCSDGNPLICARRVTSILHGGQFGIEPGYVVMGLERIAA